MNRPLLIFAAAFALALPACQADQFGSGISVSGTVQDQPFDAMAGFAESLGGSYAIILTDDPSFTCTTNPTGDYLSVEIAGVDGSGGYDAQGSVTFNQVGTVINSEPASVGTVSVTVSTDEFGDEVIEGTIDARGPTSAVSGSFDVTVCD